MIECGTGGVKVGFGGAVCVSEHVYAFGTEGWEARSEGGGWEGG